MLQKNDQSSQETKKIWVIFRKFMFGDEHVKAISNFNIKLLLIVLLYLEFKNIL